jgi:hypothetical protein
MGRIPKLGLNPKSFNGVAIVQVPLLDHMFLCGTTI